MRKIINSTYISLDGVIERPREWPSLATRASGGDDVQTELALSCDALLMGRRTYGKDIVQYGFAQLLENGLLDELRLWVHPVFVGEAAAEDLLFRPSSAAGFELLDTQTRQRDRDSQLSRPTQLER